MVSYIVGGKIKKIPLYSPPHTVVGELGLISRKL
jgi:hypothetical protein